MQQETRNTFNECVELKEQIGQDLRQSYKTLKKLVRLTTGMEETDFKYIVDMYHFREGGRPKPESEPKHVGIIKKFVTLVKYFKFLELDEIFNLKEVHGIEITVDNPIEDYDFDADTLDTIQEYGFVSTTFKGFLLEAIQRGNNITSTITEKTELIKESAKLMEENAQIKPGHFKNAVGKEVKRLKALREDKPAKLEKINEEIDKEFNSYEQSLTLLEPSEVTEEEETTDEILGDVEV